jgi:hypothetical protein
MPNGPKCEEVGMTSVDKTKCLVCANQITFIIQNNSGSCTQIGSQGRKNHYWFMGPCSSLWLLCNQSFE